MLVVVQFPLFDPRGAPELTPRDRLPVPVWPAPNTERVFVRGAGSSFERRHGGLQGYFAEDWLCRADKFIKFPDLGRIDGQWSSYPPEMAYRHLFADGRFGAKLEIGFEASGSAKVQARMWPMPFIDHVLAVPARLRQDDTPAVLIAAGHDVAAAYDRATTRHNQQASRYFGELPWQKKQEVQAGPPLVMLVANKGVRDESLPSGGVRIETGSCIIQAWRLKRHDQRFDLVAVLEHGKPSPYARNLRLFLNRTHMELVSTEFAFNAISALIARGQLGAARAQLQSLRDQRVNRITALHRRIGASTLALRGERADPVAEGADVMARIWGGRVQAILERADNLGEAIAASERSAPVAQPAGLAAGLMREVFISYRRDDSGPFAQALFERLRAFAPDVRLFKDTESLRPGGLWGDDLYQAIARCSHVIALIGPDWTGPPNSVGARRIDDPIDPVRQEVESALALEKPILPVILDGAAFPAPALPETLAALPDRNALPARRDGDLAAIVSHIVGFLRG